MINYTKRYVNIVSLIITIIINYCINNCSQILKNLNYNPNSIFNLLKTNIVKVEIQDDNIKERTEDENIEQNEKENISPLIKTNKTEEEKSIIQKNWSLNIPTISLEAEIFEGTTEKVMNKYIGHFEETSTKNGNIGLAAHNRGYTVNYFSNLKKLKEGDEIFYKYYEFEQTYIVEKNIIIKDTDWSYLKDDKINKLTLITCVENEPEYRRCVQAIQKQKEE